MTIMNMVGGGSSTKIPLAAITNLAAEQGDSEAIITWTDPIDVTYQGNTLASWVSTTLVRKTGSAPTSPTDGTVVTTSTTRNQYSSAGYTDTGLTNGTTYYYAAFSTGDNGLVTDASNTASTTPKQMTTFTVSWTQTSNPSQFNPIYSDDATGLTPGSTDFDKFFGYSAVRLSTAGVETTEVTQAQSGGDGKLDFSQLGTLTSGDNVMIKFPLRGIKMTKSGSVITLSITKLQNQSGYQYYAFNRNGTTKSRFYLGAYKAVKTTQNGVQYLRSYSGQQATDSSKDQDGIRYITLDGGCTLAQKNSGYDLYTYYQRMYIAALYMMKYGNPDCRNVVGKGFYDSSNSSNRGITGATNSILDATGATDKTSETGRIKLFGLEDRWGNGGENINGAYWNGTYSLQTSTSQAFTTGKITSFDTTTAISQATNTCMSDIIGTNTGLFLPNNKVNDSTYSTYYCAWSNGYSGRYVATENVYGTARSVLGLMNSGGGSSTAVYMARLMYI